MRGRLLGVFALVAGLCAGTPLSAKDIHVDNLLGNDRFNGLSERLVDADSGPVRTLRRALQLADFCDRVILTRAGAVYYDSLSLTGRRHSGTAMRPFTLVGNGATLSGLRTLPPQGWQQAGEGLWKLTLTRKGFNRLLRNGVSLPEVLPEKGVDSLQILADGHWTAWNGSLYLRSNAESPNRQSFSYAADQTGLSLYQVENVKIVDLTLRDFRFDGVRAQNQCRDVTLEDVVCTNNGRAGFAVTGASRVDIVGGRSFENGRYQVLISKVSSVALRDLNIDGEPTMVP